METISMSGKERRRLVAMNRVKSGALPLVEAARILGVSYRQVKRIWARYQACGDRGLVHGLRGKASNRKAKAELRERAMARYREAYADFGPTLAAEYLRKEGIVVSVTTLRRWLLAAGLWQRARKRKVHRHRRPRREQRGELVQMDGSHHDWFEGRRGWAVLMVMIDDATGHVTARFFENESWASAVVIFRHYADRHGLPQELYVDRHGIYRAEREPTADEVLAGKEPETQFGRALEELGVKLIRANSPQAKGRVERMNGTLQDRLVKALRVAGISDLAAANRFLEEQFLPELNAAFTVPAAREGDVHRAVPPGTDLERILSIQETRVVQNDWTVRVKSAFLQLDRKSGVKARDKVQVCQQVDGRVRVFAGDRELVWSPTRSEPRRSRPKPVRSGPTGSSQGQKPRADHPWRKPVLRPRQGAGERCSGASGVGAAADSASVATLPALRPPPPPPRKRKPR
jgi:transposase